MFSFFPNIHFRKHGCEVRGGSEEDAVSHVMEFRSSLTIQITVWAVHWDLEERVGKKYGSVLRFGTFLITVCALCAQARRYWKGVSMVASLRCETFLITVRAVRWISGMGLEET